MMTLIEVDTLLGGDVHVEPEGARDLLAERLDRLLVFTLMRPPR